MLTQKTLDKINKMGQLKYYKKNLNDLYPNKYPRHHVRDYRSPVKAWNSKIVIKSSEEGHVTEIVYTDGKKSTNTT